MSLESIKSDFERLYQRAKFFEELLPSNIEKPEVEIHSGFLFEMEKLDYIRFQWKKGNLILYVLIYWNDFKIVYINDELEMIDKRRLQTSFEQLIFSIEAYLQLFKIN